MSACAVPTGNYPGGRTGRDAGYQAHLKAGEVPCEECRTAHLTACQDRWADLTDEERDRRRIANAQETRRYRVNSPEKARAAKHRRMAKHREIIRTAKARPCADCEKSYPYYVMQFDHLDHEPKAFNIGVHGPTTGTPRLLAEIAKCEVVCANCHAERSFRRMQEAKEVESA